MSRRPDVDREPARPPAPAGPAATAAGARARAADRRWRPAEPPTRAAGPPSTVASMARDVVLDMGWGRLVFGQTFRRPRRSSPRLRAEAEGRRDICLYPRDPHVLVARRRRSCSSTRRYTYRLWLHRGAAAARPVRGVVRAGAARRRDDAEAVNRIYVRAAWCPAPVDVLWANQQAPPGHLPRRRGRHHGDVVGTVTGIDHVAGLRRPRGRHLACGAWPSTRSAGRPASGEALRARPWSSASRPGAAPTSTCRCMHDNQPAIRLYESSASSGCRCFAVKRKNPINERLFVGLPRGLRRPQPVRPDHRRRGDAPGHPGRGARRPGGARCGCHHGGRSDRDPRVAVRADDRGGDEPLRRQARSPAASSTGAGLPVPRGRDATFGDDDRRAFLAEVGEVVVKPARGEQGKGITVGVTDRRRARRAPSSWPGGSLPRRADRGAGAPARTCGSSSSTTRSWPPRSAGRPPSSAPAATRSRELIEAAEPPAGRGHRRRVDDPARRRDRATVASRPGYDARRRAARGRAARRPPHRQPAHRRHDPRRHRRAAPRRSPTRACAAAGASASP